MRNLNVDEIKMGPEPEFTGPINTDDIALAKAYYWYSYFYTIEDGKKWIKAWMKGKFTAKEIAHFEAFNKDATPMYICAIARMINREFEVSPDLLNRLTNHVNDILSRPIKKTEDGGVLHERIREKIRSCIGDLDSRVLDSYYRGSYEYFDPNVYQLLAEHGIRANQAGAILSYYRALLCEVENESRPDLTAAQRKSYVRFVRAIVADIERYSLNEKRVVVRKPKKKVAKSALQLVKGLKYKVEHAPLKLRSINPSEVVGAKLLWVYNTENRKLTFYHHNGRPLSVKGSTIINFDPDKSSTRVLRNPEKSLGELLVAPKASLSNWLEKLTTKATPPSGRINTDTILLKAFK